MSEAGRPTSDSDRAVRAGVIGVGHMGRNHARVYSELADVDLVGIADADTGRAVTVAEEFDTVAFGIDELLTLVDVVSVAVPTPYHADLVRQCIDAHVDVLVEKPFVEDVEEGRQLAREARESDVLVQVGHVERFNPAVQGLRDVLPGLDVQAIDAQRLGPPIDRQIDDSVVMDLMIHDVDILLSLIDSEIREIAASGTRDRQHATALLTFENGVTARLTASRITQKKVRSLFVTTTDCRVDVDYTSQSLQIHRRSYPAYVEGDSDIRYRHESVVEQPMIDSGEPLKLELQSFVDASVTNEPPVVTPEEALRALEVVMTIDKELGRTTGRAEVVEQ